MSLFFEEVTQLPGRHRTNVYALILLKLSHYKASSTSDKFFIQSLQTDVTTLYHNHEQDFAYLTRSIKKNRDEYKLISQPLALFMNNILETLDSPAFNDFFIKKSICLGDWRCRIQRLFESHIAMNLLLNPSKKMCSSIHAISVSIIEKLSLVVDDPSRLDPFLKDLGPDSDDPKTPHLALAFGRFPHTPSVDEVISVLRADKNLITILLIHFMFIRDAYCHYKLLYSPAQLGQYGGDFAAFLKLNNDDEDKDPRDFFWHYQTCAPHLYTDRGRAQFSDVLSNRIGITMLAKDRALFPGTKTAWYPDCLCQAPDLKSAYVRSLIEADIPYVAGASGMTSLFSAAMVFLGQFKTKEDQHYYLLAAVAFITGGGLHNIHEVLTIPTVRLGFFPNYKTTGNGIGNYQTFFSLFTKDEQFNKNLAQAWDATNEFLAREYPELLSIAYPTPSAQKKTDEDPQPGPSIRP